MNAAVLLTNPKYPHNVGAALRACAAYETNQMTWTGDRVPHPDKWPKKARLPREERIKAYQAVRVEQYSDTVHALRHLQEDGYTPVCVEVQAAIELPYFIHPRRAVYVFGPEDGDVAKGIRHACHQFVTIPVVGCLNLAMTVNTVLYDRMVKERSDVL
jgi:tRNA(Leu) C34 or U34 (ribose-2'-O)-methylase TrmL